MREPRIGSPHRLDQGPHHLGLHPIGQVPSVRDVSKSAPAVRDLLVLRENIGNQREVAQVLLEGFGKRL